MITQSVNHVHSLLKEPWGFAFSRNYACTICVQVAVQKMMIIPLLLSELTCHPSTVLMSFVFLSFDEDWVPVGGFVVFVCLSRVLITAPCCVCWKHKMHLSLCGRQEPTRHSVCVCFCFYFKQHHFCYTNQLLELPTISLLKEKNPRQLSRLLSWKKL